VPFIINSLYSNFVGGFPFWGDLFRIRLNKRFVLTTVRPALPQPKGTTFLGHGQIITLTLWQC